MNELNLSYREVIPDQTLPDVWREITLNTGGTQSTLQDIKVAETAGGYCYKDFAKHHTRNRFIYWRINHDVLEIVEQSLDVNLNGNKIRYRFIDTPILDGITVYETFENVIVLVPTVCSVHRLIFPHPDVLHKQEEFIGSHPDFTIASIFADATAAHAKDPVTFNVFSNPSTANSQLPHVATSLLTVDEEALFLLSYPSGETLLVRQGPSGQHYSLELKHESFVPRFISGIAEKFLSKLNDGNVVVSLLLHTIGTETYALTLSREGHLRIWTCSKAQCVAFIDVLSETSEVGQYLVPGAQNHTLRKTLDKNDLSLTLVVFMSFSTECHFHIFKPVINGGQFKMIRVNTLYSPGKDLLDFDLSCTRIWSLWRGEDGETSMYTSALGDNGSEGSYWIPVTLESLPDPNFAPDTDHADPRQAYLSHIFYPGRFPLHTISKALSIYKRSPVLCEINVSSTVLKQRVCLAVENEIQHELKETEVGDEDYLECANWCWSRFYSCCVQYHVAGLRTLGLLLLPSVSGVVLLKKSTFSFVRPMDALEHMFLCCDYASVEQFVDHPQLSEDLEVADDVIRLMSVIVYVEQQLSLAFKQTFERELAQQRSPDIVMSELVTEILTEMEEQFTWSISQKLNGCRDIYQAMHKLLELLRIESCHETKLYEPTETALISLNHLFSSVLGVSFVTQCVHQQAVVRFIICRNLLIIQNILLERGEYEWNALEAIRSVCFPEIVVLTQASYATMYLTELTTLSYLPLESMMQRLAPLKLNPVFNLKSNTSTHSISLLELFFNSVGGFEAHKMFSKLQFNEESLANWHSSLLLYVEFLTQLVWPVSGNPIFAEWLLSSGQHIWLQQYVRLLNNWCEWNNCTRNFLLATSFLCTGEHQKAQDLYVKSAKGIFTDQFLADRILTAPSSELVESKAYVNYYLKVIQLFELHGARDCAINVARTALSIADKDDPHVATLHSIQFIQHLALCHYDEAYEALVANPDLERKKDNLRDFIKTLLDGKQLDKLMSFPYTGLEELFVSIIFTRARATDSIDNVYYDFLYSYQFKRGNGYLRLAGAVMYEQAFRLIQHNTAEALEKQVKCLLAALNALSLCEVKHAWVVRPVDPDMAVEEVYLPNLAGSTEEMEKLTFHKQMEVIGIVDIKKELELASARLRLIRFDPRTLVNYQTTATELVALLTSVGIFKYALTLCSTFGLSYDVVFSSLTKQCIYLQETEDHGAWSWLIENDLHDLSVVGSLPSVMAWNLLQSYLEQFENEGKTVIHKVICQKIISMSAFIPQWLIVSYKKRNAAELLRLYFFNGRLEEAVTLAGEYILAALGYGKEHFNLLNSMMPTSPALCLPVNTIDSLIYELELQNEANPEKPLEKEHEYIKDLFVKYLDTSVRISNEMCRQKLSAAVGGSLSS